LQVPWHVLRTDLALRAIEAVLRGAAAEREIERTLRAHRELTRDERAALVEAVFGVGLWRRRLQWQCGSGEASALLQALVGGFSGAPSRLADRWSLPDWLEGHLLHELGDEADAFCEAISKRGPVCVRANRLLCTRQQLAERLQADGIETTFTQRAPAGLVVTTRGANLFGSQAWRDGWFELQDEGSQLVGLLARDSEVLDLCAGAGGKSLLLAAEGCRVLAYDVDGERLVRLRARARRAHAQVEILDEPRPARTVLVDAPCSELGTLRRGPDLRWRLDPALLETLPLLQRELLDRAALLAKERIVYVTCTVNRAENEAVAAWFDETHPAFRRRQSLVLLPHRDGTDGFFAAVWERS
jgi:16S rRNA (cytosine967-C5)-methyltransferase